MRFKAGKSGDLVRANAEESDDEAFLAYWAEARQRLMEATPSREEGIDVARVASYFAKKGLAVRPHILLTPEDVPEFRRVLAANGISNNVAEKDSFIGGYLHEVGLTFVVRDPAMEAANGPGFSEATLVHEKSHSSGKYYDMALLKTEDGTELFQPLRQGHNVAGQGGFIEEAFGAVVEMDYIQNELGLPHGFSGIDGFMDTDLGQIPGKYIAKAPNGAIAYGSSALAGYGFELLNAKDPEIIPALYRARNNVDGLREVAYRIERVSPGLYRNLRDLSYEDTGDDFKRGLDLIRRASGGDSE